jgi:hypothetical protein
MALNLKNPEVERLAAEIARITASRKPKPSAGPWQKPAASERSGGERKARARAALPALEFWRLPRLRGAVAAGDPLLFVGDDFGHTDVQPARRG